MTLNCNGQSTTETVQCSCQYHDVLDEERHWVYLLHWREPHVQENYKRKQTHAPPGVSGRGGAREMRIGQHPFDTPQHCQTRVETPANTLSKSRPSNSCRRASRYPVNVDRISRGAAYAISVMAGPLVNLHVDPFKTAWRYALAAIRSLCQPCARP
jgi:hypothetical protein